MSRLYRATVEVGILFVADTSLEDLRVSACDYLRREAEDGFHPAAVTVSVIKEATEIPKDWVPSLPWGEHEGLLAEAWLEAHPYVPTDAELEAAGQTSLLAGDGPS